MQAITIPARGGIRRDFKQLADFFKSVLVPDFQYDDFALVGWQRSQRLHRIAFRWAFRIRPLKPTRRFKFAGNPAPQTSPIIQRPIAKSSDAIMLRLCRGLSPLHQGHEGFLDDVLRLPVAQA